MSECPLVMRRAPRAQLAEDRYIYNTMVAAGPSASRSGDSIDILLHTLYIATRPGTGRTEVAHVSRRPFPRHPTWALMTTLCQASITIALPSHSLSTARLQDPYVRL